MLSKKNRFADRQNTTPIANCSLLIEDMFPNRPLTQNEQRLVQSIFADSIDCTNIKIYAVPFDWLKLNTAMSFGGHIYFPRRYFCKDFTQQNMAMKRWFVHEITHIWQSQNGFPVLFAGVLIFLSGGYFFQAAYRYQHKIKTHKTFAELNMEQQAEVIADFFTTPDTAQKNRLSPLLRDFIIHRRHSNYLPKFFA
ncbi:MAG: type IV secretion protein Rhs [Neisseriaceae bacterium]|nr:type IV secretion protein Rhs [Neisseriaceae bacterium]